MAVVSRVDPERCTCCWRRRRLRVNGTWICPACDGRWDLLARYAEFE